MQKLTRRTETASTRVNFSALASSAAAMEALRLAFAAAAFFEGTRIVDFSRLARFTSVVEKVRE